MLTEFVTEQTPHRVFQRQRPGIILNQYTTPNEISSYPDTEWASRDVVALFDMVEFSTR